MGRVPPVAMRADREKAREGWICDRPLYDGEVKNRTFVWWLDRIASEAFIIRPAGRGEHIDRREALPTGPVMGRGR